MINSNVTRSLLALVAVVLAPGVAQAVLVTSTTSDGLGTSSFADNGGGDTPIWDNSSFPTAGNEYVVAVGHRLRTPDDGNDYTFAGDSLTLRDGGTAGDSIGLTFKGTGDTGTITVDNLILDGGTINALNGPTDVFNLDGSINVLSDSLIYARQGAINLLADISGSATITNPGSDGAGRVLTLLSPSNTFTGNIVNDGRFALGTGANLNFVIGSSGINNAVSGVGAETTFDGLFNFDLTGAGTTTGDSWTIVSAANATYGENFAVGGAFNQQGSIWTDGTYVFNPGTGILSITDPPIEWLSDMDNQLFSVGANWSGGTAPGVDGDALFGVAITANRNVVLDSSVQLNRVTFNNTGDGDYFLVDNGGGETLTLSGAANIDVQAGRHWVQVPIADAASEGLTKTGPGELVLDAANTYDGPTAISGGTLSVLNANAIPAGGNISIAAGAGMQVSGGAGFFSTNGQVSAPYVGTISGVVSGEGSVVVAGDADLTLSGANTLTGAITVNNASILRATNGAALGTVDGATVLNDTSTMVLNGVTIGNEAINVEEEAQLQLNGATLGAAASGSIIRLHENSDGERAKISSSGTSTIRHNIYADTPDTGSHYEIESTSGTLSLTGVLSGFDPGTPEATPSQRIFVFSGAGNTSVAKIIDGVVDGTGNFTQVSSEDNIQVRKRGAGTLTINTMTDANDDYWYGNTVIEEGTLAVASDGLNNGELRSTVTVNSGAVFDISSFGTYNLIPILAAGEPGISGGGTVNGNGSTTLGAFEATTITPGDSVGTLKVNGNFSLTYFDADETVARNVGSLNYELGDDATQRAVDNAENDLISVSGGLTIDTNSLANQFVVNVTPVDNALDSTNNYVLINAGSLSLLDGASSSNFQVNLVDVNGDPIVARQTGSVVLNGANGEVELDISGTAFTVNWAGASSSGDGVWDVNSTPHWSGPSSGYFDLDSVNFGALPGGDATNNVEIAEAVAPAAIAFAGGENYNFTGAGAIVSGADLTHSGTGTASIANTGVNILGDVALNSGVLDGNQASGGETQINGAVTGSGNLQVTAGQIVLSGDASGFTGAMTVNGGTLNVNSATGLGGVVTVNSGGTLRSNADAYTNATPFSLNGGTFAVSGGAASAVTFTGDISVTANSAFQIDGGGGADAATVNNIGLGTNALGVNVDGGSDLNVTGAISGSGAGALNKTGGGRLVMAGGSSVTAPTVSVSGGVLDVSALNAGAGLVLASGQTLANGATVTGDVTATSGSVFRVGGSGLTPQVQYTYVDANHTTNTTLANGSPLVPAADIWEVRTGINGNSDSIYEADAADPATAPEIRTTISGLAPNTSYTVYANFWDATGSSWRIQAGESSGALTLYANPDDAVAGATGAVLASSLAHSTAITTAAANRTLYSGLLGELTTDGSGNLVVFVDDTGGSDGDDRTFYDGLSYNSGFTGQFTGTAAATLTGDLLLSSGSVLEVDLSATGADLLNVSGAATLNGTLSIDLFGADPTSGAQFTVLTAAGGLDTTGLVLGGPDAGGFSFSTIDGTDLVLTFGAAANLGDYNGDGLVDALDYAVWRENVGGSGLPFNETDNPGVVDQGDFQVWLNNFGADYNSPTPQGAAPEPGALLMVLLTMAAAGGAARRR